MKNFLLLAALLFAGALNMNAQKYGHMNFGSVIAALPETEAADKELEAYQKQLNADVEKRATAWQGKVQAFYTAVEGGTLTPVQQQQQQQALEKEQQEILQLQQSIAQKVQMKRQSLLEPIVSKVEGAINTVAKENGYQFIFDTSVFNAILFAEESDDVSEMVKAKL
ncbi:MAG: OmpH family outer membrane protein [Chitinophagales bacterium]|nr:OmpH family outer membrane protein [Chitinophagales bacterium]